MYNSGSLEFLNMIKNGSGERAARRTNEGADEKKEAEEHNFLANDSENSDEAIAVIDTETNWHDQVMSVGIAIADTGTYRCRQKKYYIFKEECRVGGMYSNVLYKCDEKPQLFFRDEAMDALRKDLMAAGVRKIFAYNAKFDYGHLPELSDFEWYDIMRLAAYKQFNRAITENCLCCKTGRLKTNYGVEPIMRMLTGDSRYYEVHNAVCDAEDELRIMELLGLCLEKYEIAKI